MEEAKQICTTSKDATDVTKDLCSTIDEEDVTQHPEFIAQAVRVLKNEVPGVKQTRRDFRPLVWRPGRWQPYCFAFIHCRSRYVCSFFGGIDCTCGPNRKCGYLSKKVSL